MIWRRGLPLIDNSSSHGNHALRLAIQVIWKPRKESFACLIVQMYVGATTKTPTLRSQLTGAIDIKFYTFAEPQSIRRTVSPRMNPSSSSFTSGQLASAEDVMVRHLGHWISLEAWLRSFPILDTPTEYVGIRGEITQAKRWASNNLTPRLLDLPRKLRMLIYDQALGPHIYPSSSNITERIFMGMGILIIPS
ncbi:hypothetical protein K432DRAFT_395971 [Lepidopterella palustris CBS 459.81]|uniref:Uncharacterized protein n=1 Tax=Lepidopterella palustris CBS 459.81 TaxID=1314670 RepID=A0A8E2JC18_9PEZI|nr:hypothetical protein K432DRAFT_395971 [Lepidopterella palustris CBS 459.81]